jgi:zinc-binding in reverse transcriptase
VLLWLLLHNRSNTTDNLQNKGWPANPECVLCSSQQPETELHLFQECRFTANLLHRITGGALQPSMTAFTPESPPVPEFGTF